MFRQGETIRPLGGGKAVICRVEQDPEGHAGYWCETESGAVLFVPESDARPSMAPGLPRRRATDFKFAVN